MDEKMLTLVKQPHIANFMAKTTGRKYVRRIEIGTFSRQHQTEF